MTKRLPRLSFILALYALFFSLSAYPLSALAKETRSAGFTGAVYQPNGSSNLDFRDTTTLSDFDLMVFRDRWRGINAEDVLTEMRKFKGVNGSPALREIWRNILLGDFSGLNIKNGQQQSELMAERIRLLNRLGYFDEASRLYLKASQKKPIPEAIAREGVEAIALSGSADGACLEVSMAVQYLHSDVWNQNAALCAAYFGEEEKAKSYYSKVADSSGAGFRTVYKMLLNDSEKAIHVGIPPLWRTLLLAKNAGVSSKALKDADGMAAAALAQNANVPFGVRLVAANRAADYGTIGSDKLRTLYEIRNPTYESVADFVEAAKTSTDMPQSDIYGAARFTFEGNARAAIVRNAMRNLHPVTNVKGHVYAWIVDKLTLQVEKLDWFAPYGFALMTATNRRASADMYYEVGELHNSPMSIVFAVLEQTPWSLNAQREWQNAMEKSGKNTQIKKAFEVTRAFDQENKLALNKDTIIASDESKPLGILTESIRKGGRGLSLVSALNRLAEAKQMSKIPTSELSEIIAILGKQGLFGERKKIALEILLQIVL